MATNMAFCKIEIVVSACVMEEGGRVDGGRLEDELFRGSKSRPGKIDMFIPFCRTPNKSFLRFSISFSMTLHSK
jgi:hypothetical protein